MFAYYSYCSINHIVTAQQAQVSRQNCGNPSPINMVFCLSGLQLVSNGKVQTMFPDFAPRLSEAAGGTHAAASHQAEPTRNLPRASNLHWTALPLTHTDHLDTALPEPGINPLVGRVGRELRLVELREMGRLVAAPLW